MSVVHGLQVQLHRALQLLDEVLQSLPIPGPEPRINRNLLLSQASGAASGASMLVNFVSDVNRHEGLLYQ